MFMGPSHIQEERVYRPGGRYVGGHLKILPTRMFNHVERINQWDEWILIDDHTATSCSVEWEKLSSSLLQNAVASGFFITNEPFPVNYNGISRRKETVPKEGRKKGRRRKSRLGLISGGLRGPIPTLPAVSLSSLLLLGTTSADAERRRHQ